MSKRSQKRSKRSGASPAPAPPAPGGPGRDRRAARQEDVDHRAEDEGDGRVRLASDAARNARPRSAARGGSEPAINAWTNAFSALVWKSGRQV